jgi:Leucine-rich repeat (LRR) protein
MSDFSYISWIQKGCPVDTEVTDLILTGTHITTDVVGNLINLKELTLSYNYELNSSVIDTTIPESVYGLRKLQKLILAHNKVSIETIKKIGFFIKTLEVLDISYNSINSLPIEINQMTTLTSLNLSNNNISFLPFEICDLVDLKSLNLSQNRIELLPQTIGGMNNLAELILSGNFLEILPNNITNLHKLKKLVVSNNRLLSIPNLIGDLCSLEILNLSNNQLTVLPPSVSRLKKIQSIDVTENPFGNKCRFTVCTIDIVEDLDWDIRF